MDVKYAVTQNLALDVTVNTDFAQVEVDEQQVNLTRFNLLFPEKREFFLEGRGVPTSGSPGWVPRGRAAAATARRPRCSTPGGLGFRERPCRCSPADD